MELLILAFWLVIIGFVAYIVLEAASQIPMTAPFPSLVKGIIIIVALVAAFKLLIPYSPF